jgi:hypothetical protein
MLIRQIDLFCVLNTSTQLRFRYAYEEFADHIRAMRTVRQWEDTSRFGHVGNAQTSRANSARVLEYFSDIYTDRKEAVYKAGLFLSIYDYIGRHAEVFSRKDWVETLDDGLISVEPALLRAVHFAFTTADRPAVIDPRKLLGLAKAFKEIERPL